MRAIVDQVGKWSDEEQQRWPGGPRWSQVDPGGPRWSQVEPGGPRWTLTSQVGRGPWSTWASPVLLLCNGDTHGSSDKRPEQPCKSNIVAGWSQIRSWQVGSRSTYYSGPRLPCTSWEPALHRNLDSACCRASTF